ncbi:MAG: ATP synthase subunit I [Acidimicrobiales bacterium]
MNEPAPAPEREIAHDMVRRAVLVGPVMLVVLGSIWGVSGALSAALALGLVIVNFLIASSLITWGARISPQMLMSTVLGGYVLRLALLTAVVLPIRHADWFSVAPFAIALIVTHLGLLVWEMRFVSATIAFPGLAPGKQSSLPINTKGSSIT